MNKENELKFAQWLSDSILLTTRATPENAFYEGIRVEQERIIKLVRDFYGNADAEQMIALIKGEQE